MTPGVRLFNARARIITLLIALAPALSQPCFAADIPELIKSLRHPLPEKRAEARKALVKAGAKAVPALVSGMKDFRQKSIMLAVLQEMDKNATADLFEILSDRELRFHAAEALAYVSDSKMASRIPALLDCTKIQELANWCGVALIKASPKAGGHLSALLSGLKSSQPEVRAFSAAAIGQIESRPKAALEPLIAVLKDPEAQVRLAAVAALGKMGSKAQIAVQKLKELENDPSSDVRVAVVEAIKNIDG